MKQVNVSHSLTPENIGEVYMSRRQVFASAHRLATPHLSEEENIKRFGNCHFIHGHNFELTVTLKAKPDPVTGMIMNLRDLKLIMLEAVVDKVDHRYLNEDIDEFKGDLPPTTEMMAIVFWNWLLPFFPNGELYEVHIRETENNIAFYRG